MPDGARKQGAQGGLGLQGFEFLERAVEGALKTGVMAGEAIVLGIEHVGLGLQNTDAAKVPGGGDQFIEESLLDWAAGIDLALIVGEDLFEIFALLGFNQELLSGEAMLAGVLGAASLAFFGTRAGAELRVSAIGLDFEFGHG